MAAKESAMHKNAIAKVAEIKPVKIVNELPAGVANWAPPGGSMVVSSPNEVDGIMAAVPEGKLITLDELRDTLAERHGTTIACPVSTAIFINIVAQAAEERRALGEGDITPWWRTLKTNGLLNERYPAGYEGHRHKLEAEGHNIVARGKKLGVEDYENKLAVL
jgi:6-O-methylguanine DNA methyltransferase, DNA binding domain